MNINIVHINIDYYVTLSYDASLHVYNKVRKLYVYIYIAICIMYLFYNFIFAMTLHYINQSVNNHV